VNRDLLSLLRIDLPIIQAPMANVSTPKLAASVSEAGGLGSIAVGHGTALQAHDAIAELRALTSRPFQVNVFCHRIAQPDPQREARWLEFLAPHFAAQGAQPPSGLRVIYNSFLDDDAMLDVFLRERPPLVSFHFGLPDAYRIRALKEAGIVLMGSATTAEEARRVEAAGCDIVAVQGYEAGGHRGNFDQNHDPAIGTFALVRLVASAVKIPVVAAGGIMDGAAIAAALRLGASGVQMGTAFIPCPESSATPHHRALLAQQGGQLETAVTDVISGRPARGFVNRLFSEVGAPGHPLVPDYPIAYDAAKALSAAAGKQGNMEYSVNWAGQEFALARALPAAELVRTLEQEMVKAGWTRQAA
jgi:nitronate monooxygenase